MGQIANQMVIELIYRARDRFKMKKTAKKQKDIQKKEKQTKETD